MRFVTQLILIAAALSGPVWAGDVDDVMATPSRAKTDVPGSDGDSAVKDYLKGVHGEVTAMVGTGGTYGFSGVAVLPLGDKGTAVVSFSTGKGLGWFSPYDQELRPLGEEPLLPYPPYRRRLR
jgi:hypothetical protein